MIKPMLASDWDESKLRFPVIAQPKIDGVRALNLEGILTARSLKQHQNRFVTALFSKPYLRGLDGEMAANMDTSPTLCRDTSSALSTIEGSPWVVWHLFDYITEHTIELPYKERYDALKSYISLLNEDKESKYIARFLTVVPNSPCANMEQLLSVERHWLNAGYEGVIIRDPEGKYKQGLSTVREGGLLRIKRFVDFEIKVTEIIEGVTNHNKAQINELGLQFRSSHQENMTGNAMVGALVGTVVSEIKDLKGQVVFQKGDSVKIGAGSMTHEDRKKYFLHPDLILGKLVKAKMFPYGIKDKPRFPTFVSLRGDL